MVSGDLGRSEVVFEITSLPLSSMSLRHDALPADLVHRPIALVSSIAG